MGLGTLTDRASGQTILDTFFNDIHAALNNDLVGRNASGVATTGQNLGTNALPWATIYANTIVLGGSSLDTSQLVSPANRIISGKVRTASNQPQFIDPDGATNAFTLEGNTTNLALDINGASVSVTTDIIKSSLTVGPSDTPTALVDDTDAADQEETRTWGEYGAEKETITVDAMGAEFQAFIGQWQIVKIAGTTNEYALVYVKSATELTNAYRGFFTDSTGAPINRAKFSNNDVITVLSTCWVFVENNGTTVDVSYRTPIKSFTAPTSPLTGDYWLDLGNSVWKRYDGASWQIINRTLVGVVGIDSSNCVCARSFDFHKGFTDVNTIELEVDTTEKAQLKYHDAKINVYGTQFNFGFNHLVWNITTDLAASADLYNGSEQASTVYYLYIKDTGDSVMSDISPHYRPDLLGWYHPHNPWRCVGQCFNDSSSNIIALDEVRYNPSVKARVSIVTYEVAAGTGGGTSTGGDWTTRPLNTVNSDDAFLDLDTNIVGLLPGIYEIETNVHHYKANGEVQNKLRNITDTKTELTGNGFCDGGTPTDGVNIPMSGVIKIGDWKTFDIQYYVTTGVANGLGAARNQGEVETFAYMKIKKVG
jgi:hypothetical protein